MQTSLSPTPTHKMGAVRDSPKVKQATTLCMVGDEKLLFVMLVTAEGCVRAAPN